MTTHLGNKALVALGHRVVVLHDEPGDPVLPDTYEDAISLPVVFDHHSKLPPRGMTGGLRALERFLSDHQVDIVHICGTPRMQVLRWLLRRFPVVITAHVPVCPNGTRYMWKQRQACDRQIGLACLTYGFRHCGCGTLGNERRVGALAFARMMVGDAMFRGALRRCAAVIAPSAWMRGRLIADGVPEDKVFVIPPPIDSVRCGPLGSTPTDLRSPVVLYVGRLVDFKGPDLILHAMTGVSLEFEVWFAGDGPMRSRLEHTAERLGLASRTRFLGALTQEQVTECYAAAAVCVVPSLCPETFGRVAAEACMHGVPVVASKVGGLPEAVRGCSRSKLVPPGDEDAIRDAILAHLRRPERKAVELDVKSSEPFRLETHAHLLLSVYERVTAGRRREHRHRECASPPKK